MVMVVAFGELITCTSITEIMGFNNARFVKQAHSLVNRRERNFRIFGAGTRINFFCVRVICRFRENLRNDAALVRHAQAALNNLLEVHGFRRATLIKRDYAFNVERTHRHDYHVQQERRSTLARLRNFLFVSALYDEDWVLWIDSDLAWYPKDIIEVMMATKKDLIVPHCLLGFNTYDYNSWQETRESLALQSTMQPEELLYEGYLEEAGVDTKRLHMTELQYRCEDEGRDQRSHLEHRREHGDSGDDQMCKEDGLVKLDGVGGAVILMRSALHREGLYFPPYAFNHSIETEGMAKMCSEMGLQAYGMPMLKVWHK